MGDDSGWVVITLEEKIARRQGVPARLPVPKNEIEGIADKGLPHDRVRKWVAAFLKEAPGSWRTENTQLARRYEAFLSKQDTWKKGQAAFEKKDFATAVSSFRLITNIDKEDHAAKLNLAAALSNLRDFATALTHLDSIRATFEGDADYHVALGQVHLALNDTERATEEMVLALEAKPDCLPALEALKNLGFLVSIYEDPKDATSLVFVRADSIVEYLVSVWDAQERGAAYYLDQIAYHQAEGRHAVVLAAAERALRAPDPTAVEALEAAHVSALRSLDRTEESITAARAALSRNAGSARLEVELARSLTAAGKSDEAAAALDRALASDPGDLMALTLKFGTEDATDLEKIGTTIGPLTTYAEKHPTSAGAVRALARAKLATGSTDDAIGLFARAVSLAPDDDDLRTEYWGELRKLGRFQDIVTDAEGLTNTAQRNWGLRWSEAESYASLGKKSEARTLFTALNMDTSLHVDIRKRAKRAAVALG